MATVKFFIQSNKPIVGIYVRIRDGRNVDAKAKTQLIINISNWNNEKGSPKNNRDADLKIITLQLATLKADLLKAFNNRNPLEIIDSNWLKNKLNPLLNASEVPSNIYEYFEHYIKYKKSMISNESIKKLYVVQRLWKRFEEFSGKKYIVKDYNINLADKFQDYCFNNSYSQNTISRAIRTIKTICYDAQENGIEISHQLKKVVSKNQTIEKIYLTKEEIEKIERTNFDIENLIIARDWLIISCETGQRVSDFLNFNKEQMCDLKSSNGGVIKALEFKQVKTKKLMTVPLSSVVLNIIAKWDNNFPPKLTSQLYNKKIKEVCELAGISQLISGGKIDVKKNRKENGIFPKYQLVTSHIGRRSFATNNYGGKIPTPILMAITGHSTEALFLEYIGKSRKEMAIAYADYIN